MFFNTELGIENFYAYIFKVPRDSVKTKSRVGEEIIMFHSMYFLSNVLLAIVHLVLKKIAYKYVCVYVHVCI